jgi:hypothetical protein
MRNYFVSAALFILVIIQPALAAPYPPLQTAGEATAAVDSVLAEAKASDRLAMLVLGGNRCHDSTDFAAMIREPELAAWLEENYTIRLFNIGYLDHIKANLAPFGVPVIYGTPTVLVVDPASGELLNPYLHY